jgi:hypothetical protein
MSAPGLVLERADDERIERSGEAFAFVPSEPIWAALVGDRPRAAGRLLGFVAAVGLGVGAGLWIVGEVVASVIRGWF